MWAEQWDQRVADPQGAEKVDPNRLERLYVEWHILTLSLVRETGIVYQQIYAPIFCRNPTAKRIDAIVACDVTLAVDDPSRATCGCSATQLFDCSLPERGGS